MALPRPSSPRALIADLRAFAASSGRHHWIALAAAVIMPAALIVLFYTDGQRNIAPKPQLILVENWPANRTDEQIKADQVTHQAKREAMQKERQRQFKALDDRLEKMGI